MSARMTTRLTLSSLTNFMVPLAPPPLVSFLFIYVDFINKVELLIIEDFEMGNDGNLIGKDQMDNQGKFYIQT
jgi:hypothetical protein